MNLINLKKDECDCHERFNCCDCGGNGCGCSGCFSCHACDICLPAEEETVNKQ